MQNAVNLGGKLISSEKKVRLNTEIRVPNVRLINAEGGQCGIVSIEEALQMASEVDFDLVEIAPNASPPVCRIMDYGKYLFQLSKKQAAAKKKQKRIKVKKIRLRPGIEEGDYQVKLRNLIRFLQEGNKVEISILLRGRQIVHKELSMRLLNRMKADLSDYSDVERTPSFEGRVMMMVLATKKQ